jgi:Xaa-Pro aminopeptidase
MSPIADVQLDPRLLDACASRLEAARQAMAAAQVQAMVFTNAADVIWLTGTHGHDAQVLVLPDTVFVLSDRRYEEYLAPWAASGRYQVDLSPRTDQPARLKAIASQAGIDTLGVQAESICMSTHQAMVRTMDPVQIKGIDSLLGELRQCKDALEIEACSAAIGIQASALEATFDAMEPGWTEARFAARLIEQMRSRGAQCEAFEPIIGAGTNSSVIHHIPGQAVIKPGILLVDWGAKVDSRCSDMTRTFFLGDSPEQLVELFSIVEAAHGAAVAACAPGVPVTEIDAAARRIIDDAGYADQFPHGVGHGLGLDVHETPFMGRKGEAACLRAGMIVTIEPGIYLPGIGGVRIEDDLLITRDGHRVLSDAVPRDLEWSTRDFPG